MSLKVWFIIIGIILIAGLFTFILINKGDISIEGINIIFKDTSNYSYKSVQYLIDEENDLVYIDDANVFLSASPHTFIGSSDVIFNLTSKHYTGNIDMIWGFDTNYLKPKFAQRYSPHEVIQDHNYTCAYEFNYTLNPNYFWCYEIGLNPDGEEYTNIIFEHSFDSGNLSLKTAYWRDIFIEDWVDFTGSFTKVNLNINGYDTWYVAKNLPITENINYAMKVRIIQTSWFIPEHNKYWVAIKPSGETLNEALSNNHFYALDPWQDSLNTSLVAYWTLNESSGNAVDVINGYSGDVIGTTQGNTSAMSGTAYHFDGVNDLVSLIAPADLTFGTGNFTVNFWMRNDDPDYTAIVHSGVSGAGDYGWSLRTSNTGIIRSSDKAGNAACIGSTDTRGGNYVMVTFVRNNTGAAGNAIYINAVKEDDCDGSDDYSTPGNFSLGYVPYDSGSDFTGNLDEVMIWKGRALSPIEIETLYNSGTGIFYTPPGAPPPDTPPTITITYPPEDIQFNSTLITFNATASDDRNLTVVDFYINGSLKDSLYEAWNQNGTDYKYTANVLTEGAYYGYFEACDNSSQCVESPFINFTLVFQAPIVELNLPIDDYNETSSNTIQFSCNVSDDVKLENVSLFLDDALNVTNSSGLNNSIYYFSIDSIAEGVHNWTCQGVDNQSKKSNATARDFIVDLNGPSLIINYPNITIPYFVEGNNLTLNWSIEEEGENMTDHIINCTYDYDNINTTISNNTICTQVNETTFPYVVGINNLTMFTVDKFGFMTSNVTLWQILAVERSITYDVATSTTSSEEFILNITVNGTMPNNAYLNYNGTMHSASITNISENNITINSTIDIGSAIGTFNFSFGFYINGEIINSTVRNQSITDIAFALCNATFTIPFLNFSFENEANGTHLDALNDLTEVTFWIGDGSSTADYLTSNSTANHNYTFCFNPSNVPVTIDMNFKYSALGYPLRTFAYNNEILTNETTNQRLYLLSSADGLYSSIQVVDVTGSPLQSVIVTIERQIDGTWVIIGQDTTGDDGLTTFWINPNFQHRITAVKTGYGNQQVTIMPSQSIYTLTMLSSAGNATYSPDLDGLKWQMLPSSGVLNIGIRSFNATVTADKNNLVNCSLILVNASNITQILNLTYSLINESYCFLDVRYNLTNNLEIFGKLSLNTSSSEGWFIVDSDWKWVTIDTSIKGWRKITSLFADLKDIGEFGEGKKGEFSRIMTFFIILAILIGMFHFFTGVDITNPGITIIILMGIAYIASIGGFFTVPLNSNALGGTFFNQYGIAFMMTLLVLSYMLKSYMEGYQ